MKIAPVSLLNSSINLARMRHDDKGFAKLQVGVLPGLLLSKQITFSCVEVQWNGSKQSYATVRLTDSERPQCL